MAHYFLEGSSKTPVQRDADGHVYRIMLNDKKIFGGSWGDCVYHVMDIAQDTDIFTDSAKTESIRDLKDSWIKDARRMGGKTDIPAKIFEYEDEISYSIGNAGQSANRALNKFHTKKETIPLDEQVQESLSNACHNLMACRRIPVIVSVYSNGDVKLKVRSSCFAESDTSR